jgi:hypothetical protein
MKIIKADFGNWHIQCIPEDGARISVLKYAGHDLLTANQPAFKPPERFYGEYETRPVYGYDDCFPTVDQCIYPNEQFECRDHGELCWMKWQVKLESNKLICHVDCLKPKVNFKRTLEFIGSSLKWEFEVFNISDTMLAFLHVMHALMPLKEIQCIKLPGFNKIIDDINAVGLDLKEAKDIAEHLLDLKSGTFEMLLLKDVKKGLIHLGFKNGLTLKIDYNIELFPTIGIWWNNSGYPDEEGLQRAECAFEPIPGINSNLEQSFADGTCLQVEPGKTLNWEINWNIEKK